jgi:hypothetical protein
MGMLFAYSIILEQQRCNRIGFKLVSLQVSHSTLQDMDECAAQPYF